MIDEKDAKILRRAHFESEPSEDELEEISVVEAEIDADFSDKFVADTEVQIAPLGVPLAFLPGDIAYLRAAKAGFEPSSS